MAPLLITLENMNIFHRHEYTHTMIIRMLIKGNLKTIANYHYFIHHQSHFLFKYCTYVLIEQQFLINPDWTAEQIKRFGSATDLSNIHRCLVMPCASVLFENRNLMTSTSVGYHIVILFKYNVIAIIVI